MTKNAYYFSHDSNARHDEKILMLRAEHGWEGYGLYWALVEMMFDSGDTALSHDKIKGVSLSLGTDMALLSAVIDTCIAEGLFVTDGDTFWSDSLRRRKSKFTEKNERQRKQKSEAGKKGAAARWGKDGTEYSAMEEEADNSNGLDSTDIAENGTSIADDSRPMTDDSKGKERKGKERKGNESKVNKNTHNTRAREATGTLSLDAFETFWAKYPNKTMKEQTASLWVSIDPGESEQKEIMEGLGRWLASDQWERGIYQSPVNWLRDRRWLDDPPKAKKTSGNPFLEMMAEEEAGEGVFF